MPLASVGRGEKKRGRSSDEANPAMPDWIKDKEVGGSQKKEGWEKKRVLCSPP